MVLATHPSLILADEPTGELDTENGQRVLDLFEVLNKDMAKTVLVGTHDQRVSKISRRILQIEDGMIIDEAVPTQAAGLSFGGGGCVDPANILKIHRYLSLERPYSRIRGSSIF